jgi:heme oxygenase-like protein
MLRPKPRLVTQVRQRWIAYATELRRTHYLWRCPFISTLKDASSNPQLSLQLLRVWATSMVHISFNFPRYAATLAVRAEEDAVRHGLLENAWDESGGPEHTARSHVWHAARLVRFVGIAEYEIERIEPLLSARKYTEEHLRSAREAEDILFPLGMICLIEAWAVPLFQFLESAWERALTSAKVSMDEFEQHGRPYFFHNIKDDGRHSVDMADVLAALLDSRGVPLDDHETIDQSLELAKKGGEHSADLRAQFYDEIFEFVKSGHTERDLIY